MTEIPRIGRKKRRHVYVSRELEATMDELLDRHVRVSPWIEDAVWTVLVEEYGEEAVLEAVENAQDEMDLDAKLPEAQQGTIVLP
jgi:hypothetical protein